MNVLLPCNVSNNAHEANAYFQASGHCLDTKKYLQSTKFAFARIKTMNSAIYFVLNNIQDAISRYAAKDVFFLW